MKKYKISLALKIPANFEMEISAKTEKEALKIALRKYYSNSYNENNITEPDWANHELDIDEKGKMDNIGNGIFIEEIE